MYEYYLTFKLNKFQKECSEQIVGYYKNGYDILLDAVCGAGKTEMLLEVIKVALNENKIIGFACPRKQLTIELYERIKEYFRYDKIGLIVGGYQIYQNSNFIFMTTHQLYKFRDYFDLLIIDEVDAFPFCDNYKLENKAIQSSKQFIYLSATVPQKYYELVKLGKVKIVVNNKRHHLQPIPFFKFVKVNDGTIFLKFLKSYMDIKDKPIIVFVPTIKIGKKISFLLKLFLIKNKFVYGKNISEQDLLDFKQRRIRVLISTTVLERGITLKGLQIIVYDASHKIFNSSTLIQIIGRVGRDSIIHYGEIIFIGKKYNEEIQKCKNVLKGYRSE